MKYLTRGTSTVVTIDSEFSGRTVRDFLLFYNRSSISGFTLALNNRQAQPDDLLLTGDRLEINIPEREIDYPVSDRECEVLYEDDFVYVVHKDPGIIIHDPENECLARQAALYQSLHGINQPVRYIHRLDRNTTGLVMFVKNPFFQPWFDAQLKEKNIHRTYLAITVGSAKEGQHFTYNQPIGKDRHVNGKYRISPTGKEALTKCTVLKKKNGYLLIECSLETGRTHQIRVHLSSNRHPIVNDEIYGVRSTDFKNMGLWAYRISFTNPLTHEQITVTDRENPDFRYFNK